MAGITNMTPERWNTHLGDQVAQIVTHLNKDNLSQAYQIFHERIYCYGEDAATGNIFSYVQDLSIAIHDLRFSGKTRAKNVENVARAHLPGFKPTTLSEPQKPKVSVSKLLTGEMDALEFLQLSGSLNVEAGVQPKIVKPVARRLTPHAQNDHSFSLGEGVVAGAAKKEKSTQQQGFDFADEYVTSSRTPSPTLTLPIVYRSQDSSPTPELDRSTLPTLQFISGDATEVAGNGEDYSELIKQIAVMDDPMLLAEIGASTNSLEVRAAIDKRLAQLKSDNAPA